MPSRNLRIQTTAIDPAQQRLATGWVFSGLAILFLVIDGAAKLAFHEIALDPITTLGYPGEALYLLGAVELAFAGIYALSRTALLGAILLAGYLGAAIAAHTSLGDPIFPVLFSAFIWTGLYLRQTRPGAFIPRN